MAEVASQRPDSPRAACKSKSSRAQVVRVVHIGKPRVVTASASEFRAVVQSLTGRKRSSTSVFHHDLLSERLTRDSCEKPPVKLPKLKDHLQDCPILNIPQPETTPAVFSDRNNRDGGTRWNVQFDEIYDIFANQMFDTLESIEEIFFPRVPL